MTEGLTNKDKAKIKAWFTKKLKPAGKRKPLTTFEICLERKDLNTLLTQSLDKLADIQDR